MRLAYSANAVSKRVSNFDSGEEVFGAGDMMKWEGGWMLWVEVRRRGKVDRDSRVY